MHIHSHLRDILFSTSNLSPEPPAFTWGSEAILACVEDPRTTDRAAALLYLLGTCCRCAHIPSPYILATNAPHLYMAM